MLVAFPLSAPDILQWAAELERLMPFDDLRKLPFLMDSFKTGEILWDKAEGIQNIFKGVKLIEETAPGEFKINRPIW